jgi:transcriptional regulator with XRE-family HTH domain
MIALRTLNGWSQAELARSYHKDRQAFETIENGKVNPTFYTLLVLPSALNLSHP